MVNSEIELSLGVIIVILIFKVVYLGVLKVYLDFLLFKVLKGKVVLLFGFGGLNGYLFVL